MITHAYKSIQLCLMVSDKKSFKGYLNRNKLSALGSHVEFPIDTKNITFVEHHTEHFMPSFVKIDQVVSEEKSFK